MKRRGREKGSKFPPAFDSSARIDKKILPGIIKTVQFIARSIFMQKQSFSPFSLKKRFINRAAILFISLFALCSLAGIATWAQVTDGSKPRDVTRSSATVATTEISKHIYYLASDELQGRRSGTPGCERA